MYKFLKNLGKSAARFTDLGTKFGLGEHLVQMVSYPAHEFLIKPTITKVEVEPITEGFKVTWSNQFNEAPEQYELTLFNRDDASTVDPEQEFLVDGSVNSYVFENLPPGTEYSITVKAIDYLNGKPQSELIASGINYIRATTLLTGYTLKISLGIRDVARVETVIKDHIKPTSDPGPTSSEPITLRNHVYYAFVLQFNGEEVGIFGKSFDSPVMLEDYSLKDYKIIIDDTVNGKRINFPINIILNNEFYRRILNKSFTMTRELTDPNSGDVTTEFVANLTVEANNDPLVSGSIKYSINGSEHYGKIDYYTKLKGYSNNNCKPPGLGFGPDDTLIHGLFTFTGMSDTYIQDFNDGLGLFWLGFGIPNTKYLYFMVYEDRICGDSYILQ